jgi:hypothetical protein
MAEPTILEKFLLHVKELKKASEDGEDGFTHEFMVH